GSIGARGYRVRGTKPRGLTRGVGRAASKPDERLNRLRARDVQAACRLPPGRVGPMLSSMSLWHSTVRAALGVFVVAAVSSRAAPARADESGWFDAQPAPAGTASAPAPTPAPAPAEGPAPGSE